jgi:hypothetical protein
MVQTGWLTVILVVTAAAITPVNVSAQTQQTKPSRGAAPAARPAPPRAVFHPPAAHIAPPRAVQRAAPHVAPPRINVQRHAPPHPPSATTRIIQQQPHRERAQRHLPEQRLQHSPQQSASPRILQRQERAQRQREDRALRQLPPPQRAQRREQIQHDREQRALSRQQTLPNAVGAQPNAAIQRTTPPRNAARGPRRNGRPRLSAQAAQQGRFAAAFAGRQHAGVRHARGAPMAARRAWRHGRRAGFVAWYGPVFWPYAYSDIFDYTFWPDGYDDGYWAYAYDGFFDGVFWGDSGPPAEYVGAEPSFSAPRPSYAAVQELCKQPGSGVTAWPIAEIERKVGLDAGQKELLAGVRRAAEKAASVFEVSCPSPDAFPLTPPGRLQAMIGRLQATLEAVQSVRPALDTFYNSLSDEQKERFNEIGPKPQQTGAGAAQASAPDAQSCKEQKPGLSTLPIEKIEDVVKPTDAQETELGALQDATNKAVSILQAACPEDTPLTPPGRLEVMATRLKAMIDAANTVRPALDSFYASLSNEQKARFNRIGRALAAND